MLRKALSLFCMVLGLSMVLTGLGGHISPSAALAQSVPQPTPRPPLPPEGEKKSGIQQGSGMGHIAGTVIDLTTGAPAANVVVAVGEYLLTTDVNGNYDRWLPSTTYTVTLMLTKSQGKAAQPELMVSLPTDERVIQHLAFYGAQAAAPVAPAPTTAPAIEPTAVSAPAAPAEPAPAAPAEPAPAKAQTPEQSAPIHSSAAPARLPRTAVGDDPQVLWIWLSTGFVLMAAGLFIGTRRDSMRVPAVALASYAVQHQQPQRTSSADAAALLAALLTTEMRAAKRGNSDDRLLLALLNKNADHRSTAQDLLSELLSQPVRSA